jgi:hypothetical protein
VVLEHKLHYDLLRVVFVDLFAIFGESVGVLDWLCLQSPLTKTLFIRIFIICINRTFTDFESIIYVFLGDVFLWLTRVWMNGVYVLYYEHDVFWISVFHR